MSLASASPFVQPSLSRNGKWLTFIQLRPSFFAVMRYDVLNNKYKEIRKVPRRKKLFHPSISDDGNIIGWSENRNQSRYLVKNVSENTLTQVVNNPWGIEHGYLSAGGDMLVYSINNESNGKYQTLITDLDTMTTSRIGNLQAHPERVLGTSWLGSSTQQAEFANFSRQVYVNPYEPLPIVLAFDSNGYGVEFANDGEYSYSGDTTNGFIWRMSEDGKLIVDYDSVTDSVNDETGVVTVTFNYQQDNRYNVHAVGSDINDNFISDFLKLKPLSLADLDGKIFKGMTDSDQCLTSIKIDGIRAMTRSYCGYEIETSESTLSEHERLDNVIVATGTEFDPWSASDKLPETYIGLAEGSIVGGETFKLLGIKEPNLNPVSRVYLDEFSLSNQELMPVFDGNLTLGVDKRYEADQSSNKETNQISLDTDELVNSFAIDIVEVSGYANSARIETDIRLKYQPEVNNSTNQVFAVMRLEQVNGGDVGMIPFIGICLNADCSNEKMLNVPNIPEASVDWSGFSNKIKLAVAFNESTQTFTFKLNKQSLNMSLDYFYSELGLPSVLVKSADAVGELRATGRSITSPWDFAKIDVSVDTAYVNGKVYDDFETEGEVADGKWDTSQAH